MPDLVFTSKGQAEALAAQESIAKKAREMKDEFESGAKSVGAWDANMAKLQRTSESALRSVATEQEKIAEKISVIQERQEKGIGTTDENAAAIARLRGQWVELDEATKKQREDAERVAQAHEHLKMSAGQAVESVATDAEKAAKEIEKLGDEIDTVQQAMDKGLIPQDVGQQTIERLNDRMEELKNEVQSTDTSGGRLQRTFQKLFDPALLVKFVGGFIGIKAAIKTFRDELDDLQKRIDKRTTFFQKPAERKEQLDKDFEAQQAVAEQAGKQAADAAKDVREAERQQLEQRRGITERIGEMEREIAEARADAEKATDKATADRKKRMEEAGLNLSDVLEDIAEADDPNSKANKRRLRDARQREREAFALPISGAASVVTAQERIADLERQLAKLRRELRQPGQGVGAAGLRLTETRRKAVEEAEALAGISRDREALVGGPEYQRAGRSGKIDKAAEKLFKDLANMSDEASLGADQLEKFGDAFREKGQGALARKMDRFVQRLDDGVITLDEVIAQLQSQQRVAAGEARTGRALIGAGTLPISDEERRRQEIIAQATQGTVEALKEILAEMRNNRGGLTNTPE